MADYIVNELQQALSALREGLQISAEYHINNALREHKQRLTKRAPDRAKSAVKKSSSTTTRKSTRRGR